MGDVKAGPVRLSFNSQLRRRLSFGRSSGASSDSRGIRPDRADGTRREGDAEWLDPVGGVSAVGWAQMARPGAHGVSRAGSARTPCHLF